MARVTLFLVIPFLPGCLAYGYPLLTYTPAVSNLPLEIRAFKASCEMAGTSIVMTGGERVACKLEEIPVTHGHLDAQHEAHFDYSVGGFPVRFFESHEWRIILYRPGYEIIEIPNRWSGGKLIQPALAELEWKPAPNFDSQLKALEALYLHHPWGPLDEPLRQFFIQEFERLAASSLVASEEQREILHARIRRLQDESRQMP
jgi:hypothetical protein